MEFSPDAISTAVGEALRAARLRRGMKLRDVEAATEGAFKASSIAGYERGERAISVQRFLALAVIYGVSPDRLMSDVTTGMSRRSAAKVLIDLSRLSAVDLRESQAVKEAAERIRRQRRDPQVHIISFRSTDLDELAFTLNEHPGELLDKLQPALLRTH